MSLFEKEKYTESDILQLISDGVEESINLEFKSAGALDKSPSKKKEIGKDISSMANSAGGIIIYGINESNHKAESISFINGNEFTKEWIEQVIQTNVQRKIVDLKIYPIRFKNQVEESVFVIKIPESENAPHMALDNKFYRRYNFQAVPMEEYEVRQLYYRTKNTRLEIHDDLIVNQAGHTGSGTTPKLIRFNLKILVKNIGNVIEDKYKLEVGIPKKILGEYNRFSHDNTILLREDENYRVFSAPNKSPIFQNELNTLLEFSLKIDQYTVNQLFINLPTP
jgi:Schlafen, AlbA_2